MMPAAMRCLAFPLTGLTTYHLAMRPASMTSTIATTFDALMAAGELVNEADFCARSGLTPQQVDAAVDSGRLFRLEVGRARGYPAFLLDPALDRNQVEAVAEVLADRPAGARLAFFTTPRGSLATSGPVANGVLSGTGTPRTPVEALRDGQFERVKQAALSSNGR